MISLKQLALQIPGAKSIQRIRWRRAAEQKLRTQTPKQVFSEIYQSNRWEAEYSRSGTGSELLQTQSIAKAIPRLLAQLNIELFLDVPCGDFNWMKEVDLGETRYIGADIVGEIVQRNRELFTNQNRTFQTLDLIQDQMPKADLVFCRDCLVHLSFNDISKALKNLCESGSTWLLTTTFPNRDVNSDILTGQWRVLNFEKVPFNFPAPTQLINERCTEGNGEYRDKSLGLWKIKDIEPRVNAIQLRSATK